MTDYEPTFGGYFPLTQRVANGLPSWSNIRKRRDSVGQALLNAGIGRPHDLLWDELDRFIRNAFPLTTEANQPDLITEVHIPEGVPTEQPTKQINRLLNSSFEIWSNQSTLPDWWRWSGTGTVGITDTGFIGKRAATLQADLGESVTIYNEFEEDIPANTTWTFSAWYKITDQPSGLTVPSTGFGLEAVGYCADGTTETLRSSFSTTTYGQPKKISVTGSFTKHVTKVRVQAVVTHSASFVFPYTVTVDLFQAEEGTGSSWIPNIFDNWPHVTILHTLAPVVLESGWRAQFVETLRDYWLRAVPTRAAYNTTIVESDDADPAPSGDYSIGTAGTFYEIDFFDDEWPYTYEAYCSSGAYKIRAIGTKVADILADYYLAFRNYRTYFEIDTSVTIEAITWFSGYLWVVHKKTDWHGTTKRYLSVVSVETVWPRPSYLEALVTLELPTPSVGTLITQVTFLHEDGQHIYIGDGHTFYVYDLFYDYFTMSGRNIQLREQPSRITIVPMEPVREESTEGKQRSQMMDRRNRREP